MPTFVLPFEKMQGLGNDFVLLHHKHLPPKIALKDLAKKLCNRHFGIGADGLIIVKPPEEIGDFAWIYLNADGSEGEMCGNGMRCFARYVYDRGLTKSTGFSVETLAGLIEPEILEDGLVRVDMGAPIFEASLIPVLSEQGEILNEEVLVLDRTFHYSAASMGNPHAVIFLSEQENLSDFPLEQYGSAFQADPRFPAGANIGFAKLSDKKNNFELRVWERGCGATLACGTGACAAVVVAIRLGLCSRASECIVQLPGGKLSVVWPETGNVLMTGPAQSVFLGQMELELA